MFALYTLGKHAFIWTLHKMTKSANNFQCISLNFIQFTTTSYQNYSFFLVFSTLYSSESQQQIQTIILNGYCQLLHSTQFRFNEVKIFDSLQAISMISSQPMISGAPFWESWRTRWVALVSWASSFHLGYDVMLPIEYMFTWVQIGHAQVCFW